jgi:hypothetical protein
VLSGDKVYLKAEGNFFEADNGATNPGDFYYSYDGVIWIKLGGTLNMIYSTGNHFMGYRFGLYSYAKTDEGGWADFDFFRLYDKLTADTAPAVLRAKMYDIGKAPDSGVVNVPIMLEPLPEGGYSEITASFDIPDGLAVKDVIFGNSVKGSAAYSVSGNQLKLVVTGRQANFQPEGFDTFATIALEINSPLSGPVVVKPDYINVRGGAYVAYNLNGVRTVISPDELTTGFDAVMTKTGETLSVTADVYSGPTAISARAIAVVYAKTGQMLAMSEKSVDITAYDSKEVQFSFDISGMDAGYTVKVFLWDKVTYAPLFDAAVPIEL